MTSIDHLRASSRRAISILGLLGALAPVGLALGGTWTPLAHTAPGGVNLMLLLSDGTVMAANNDGSSIGNSWYLLTPDVHGSYLNGTWSTLADAHDSRLYYPSQVLRDGRVFVAGGEYGSGGPFAEVYDPLTNVWTQTNPPPALWNTGSDNFYDCNSEMTPDGKVLLMPVFPHSSGVPLRYNPVTNSWSNAGHLFRGVYQDEASWVKLADDSILTIDPFGTQTERYIPATDTWVDDGVVPVSLYDPYGFELGAAFLLPNGKAFFLGSTGHTALYTPTGTTSPGTWVAGPDIPGAHGTPDAPGAMMVNGKILCAVSPVPTSGNHFPSPTTFYEYDWVSNSFASVNGPHGATEPGSCYEDVMLDLPDGTVLFSHFSNQLYTYTPTGAPLAAGKPTISSISLNGDGSYHLIGTGLNGISEGASYGDDFQMNTNYPLVRLDDGAGTITYARTYDWSSTGVQTGAAPVTTEFRLPASFPAGSYSLVVVANGIASDPTPFTPLGCATTPSTYCTAKVNSQLCVPSIGSTGTPSASAGSGFVIDATHVLPLKAGLLFYSTLGPGGAPFQNGYLCATPPTKRTKIQTSSSTGPAPCIGMYVYDFNVRIASGADPALVLGQQVWSQYWTRDAGDAVGTGLTNGLTFTICM